MSDLDRYFNGDGDWEGHPKLRFWVSYLQRPDVGEVRFELRRPREGLTFRPAKIYMHFYDKAGQEIQCDGEDWDDGLNTGLLRRGIRAITPENEMERFALALRVAFKRPEYRYGEGYFNSVLTTLLREGPFADDPQVAGVLRHTTAIPPETSSPSFLDCAEMIDLAIRGRAHELVDDLSYERKQAEEILAGALARYLDERFSVTSRRSLGLLA
jgi:hypothetical protein